MPSSDSDEKLDLNTMPRRSGNLVRDHEGESSTEFKPDTQTIHHGEKDQEEFPEGGRGWLVLIGTSIILNMSFGMVNTYGQYQLYYQEQFPDTSSSVLSTIGSLQPTVIYITCIPVVALINSFGVHLTLVFGSLIMVFSLMMVSICRDIWQFYLAQGVLFGIGAGITFFTAMSIPSEWFKRRRATALGITAAGSSIGGLVWPIAFQRLVVQVGFAWANRIIAFIYLPFLLFASAAVKSRFPTIEGNGTVTGNNIWPDWSVCRDWKFLWLCIANMIGLMGLFPPLFYISAFSKALGVRDNLSHYILAVVNALSLLGRIAPPLVADKVGRLNVLIPCTMFIGVLQYALWIPARTESVLVAFAICWGAISGSYIALIPPTIGQLFGISGNKSRLSICFLIAAPGCLAGPSIAGTFVPTVNPNVMDYCRVAAYSGSMMTGAALMFLILRISITKKMVFI